MQIRLSQQKPFRLRLHRGRCLPILAVVTLLAIAHRLIPLQPDGVTAALLLFLLLVLFGALGAGRELLSPSLTELAFYSFIIVATMAIWPGARLATVAYEATGVVPLFAFMGFALTLAIALGVVAVKLLSGNDGET